MAPREQESETGVRQEQTSLSNLLARERSREAAERTLLAWIRTALSLISFGFAIYKVVQTIGGGNQSAHPMTVLLGMCFILLGIFSMSGATVQYKEVLKQLQLEDSPYKPKRPLVLFVSIAVIGIGILAVTTVIYEYFIFRK